MGSGAMAAGTHQPQTPEGEGLLTQCLPLWSCRAQQRAHLSISPREAPSNLTWFEFLSE